MLTSDLAQSYVRGTNVRPRLVAETDACALRAAADLIEIVRQHLHLRRSALEAAFNEYVGAGTDYKTLRGLMKIISDECEFETVSGVAPTEIRRHLFLAARAAHPVIRDVNSSSINSASNVKNIASHESERISFDDARKRIIEETARHFSCEPEEIEQGLYADLPSNERLVAFNEMTPLELLRRYNLAQAQALLYRATAMRVYLRPNEPENSRALFDAVKAYGLIHSIKGNAQSGYEINLSGPVSLFHRSQKYGIRMAVFLPALLLCKGWRMRAEIATKSPDGKRASVAYYELDDAQTILHSHYAKPRNDSSLAETLLEKWSRVDCAWTLARTREVIDLGAAAFAPDLISAHKESGRRVYIETLGFWTPQYLKKRIDEFAAERFTDWLILASDELRCSRDAAQNIPPNVIICKSSPDARKIVDALNASS